MESGSSHYHLHRIPGLNITLLPPSSQSRASAGDIAGTVHLYTPVRGRQTLSHRQGTSPVTTCYHGPKHLQVKLKVIEKNPIKFLVLKSFNFTPTRRIKKTLNEFRECEEHEDIWQNAPSSHVAPLSLRLAIGDL